MYRLLAYFSLWLLILGFSNSLRAATYGVGGCNPSLTNFPTIQAAVSGVPAGSTIQICPGVYQEQVTISQPLTLQGRSFNNAGRVTIIINPNSSLTPNTHAWGLDLYAQVLVQNVNPPGPVNIIGITVDGSGGDVGCNGTSGLAGILYDAGTTGTVNEVATRNQKSEGCGHGILAFNGPGPNQTITVENSSVHDFDYGITTLTSGTVSTLTATIQGNFLTASGPQIINEWGAITAESTTASITGNFATGGEHGIDISNSDPSSPSTVANNAVADIGSGVGFGIVLARTSSMAQANRISNVSTGVLVIGGDPAAPAWAGPTIRGNLFHNSNYGIDFALLSCPTGLTVDQNIFNDSAIAFNKAPASLGGKNQLDNIDAIQVPGSCP